jgi:predicted secreted protein
MKPTNLVKSIDVILKINNKVVGGQQNASLVRQAAVIDITNKINGEWSESLAGTKSWSINCGGLYLVDSTSLEIIEDAFLKNYPVEVSFAIGDQKYSGSCLIVDFPLNTIFNNQFKYNMRLLGTGALNVSKDRPTNL